MYIPSEFQEMRPAEIQRIIQEYPLACIVIHTPQGLIATHVPLIFKNDSILLGHIAVQNDLHQPIAEQQEVLCIFKAEDAYISANDYPSKFIDHKKVPTWNYQVVHMYGKLKFYNDKKSKLAAVGLVTKQQEFKTNGKNGWKMSDAPKDYIDALLDELVVFEIDITRVLAQSKLSQNREAKDFENVITRLKQREKEKLAEQMENLK